MSETSDGFDEAFELLYAINETVTVTFGSATALGVLTAISLDGEDYRVRKDGAKGYKLHLRSDAFTTMPKLNETITIASRKHRILSAPLTPSHVFSYEIDQGFAS